MKRVIVPLCLVLLTVLLIANVAHAQISGISIELVNSPTQTVAGETISITVTVRKHQGAAITGYLRSYLLARAEDVAGFTGSDNFSSSGVSYVVLNEEGRGYPAPGNRISISMDENETEHTYVLTNKIMGECPTTEALLIARLSNIDNIRGLRYDSRALVFIESYSLRPLSIAKITVAAMVISAMIWVTAKKSDKTSRRKPKKR